MKRAFPIDFQFGASTASYQIEGAVNKDGRGPSIWDTFSHTPGKVHKGDTGDVACDHYHRYEEDFDLLKQLHAKVYRFSVAWPRILPKGKGAINPQGLAFYDRLVDSVLERDVQPWVCLYHWDLPQALQDLGGWCNRDIQYWFRDYALTVAEKLGDRVKHFAMFNEACVTAWVGHGEGVHAPGIKNENAMFAATHHQNLAQGLAIHSLRQAHSDLQLGTVLNLTPAMAAKGGQAHEEAARWFDACWNLNFLDPLIKGGYPQLTQAALEEFIKPSDLSVIQQPIDFLGLNYYFKARLLANPDVPMGMEWEVPTDVPVSEMGWAIEAKPFYDQLMSLKEAYGNPRLFITENGGAFPDNQWEGGRIQDDDRIDYFHTYLGAVLDAIDQGANIEGYFLWSLLDNYEWACGYDKRFGVVHVDYESLKRTPKASFEYMAKVMEENALFEVRPVLAT
jgi:beta-glucosidase